MSSSTLPSGWSMLPSGWIVSTRWLALTDQINACYEDHRASTDQRSTRPRSTMSASTTTPNRRLGSGKLGEPGPCPALTLAAYLRRGAPSVTSSQLPCSAEDVTGADLIGWIF